MIDSHCHLAHEKFGGDLLDVLRRAKDAGVSIMVTIGTSLAESKANIGLAGAHEEVYCTVGLHPHRAKDWNESDAVLIRDFSKHPKVVGIGEIGLDYHYMHSPRDIQKQVFRAQLALALELSLPVVVHTREAIEDTWEIVNDLRPSRLVLHCCSEEWKDVERFVERGYFLSFTGIITYPKAEAIRETARRCPMENLMIETDAPFLAPVPHRGKRNEPAFVIKVAERIAEIKGLSIEEVDKATTSNARRFYGIRDSPISSSPVPAPPARMDPPRFPRVS